MHNHSPWWVVPAAIVPLTVCASAQATQYLNTAEAQQALFPNADRFVSQPVKLSAGQRKLVERYSDVRMRTKQQPVWRVQKDDTTIGWFIVDEVYGKHEFITYAVGLDATGAVTGIEIMDYRETHGSQVRNADWRAQFNGHRYGDELKLGDTVANIGGATLSCKHITEGVRRVLAIYRETLQ